MITVAVVNTKGGVGKTTLAAALAVRASQPAREGAQPPLVCMVDFDPQESLAKWRGRRPKPENDSPCIFTGVDEAADAVERAALAGYEWCFLDGPPAFLVTIEEMISAADFALIPAKPSTVDLQATEDAVVLARKTGTPFLCVFSDVGPGDTKIANKAREMFVGAQVPVAKTSIVHRISHIQGMNAGKTAAEVNGGKDKLAANEIESLWQEVRAAAIKAAKSRDKREAEVDG